jgi:hypothetical protein
MAPRAYHPAGGTKRQVAQNALLREEIDPLRALEDLVCKGCVHPLCSSTLAWAKGGNLLDRLHPAGAGTNENTAAQRSNGQKKGGHGPSGKASIPGRRHSLQRFRTAIPAADASHANLIMSSPSCRARSWRTTWQTLAHGKRTLSE